MPQDFRIFLSAVTGEFGRARDIVAADLRARGLTVRVQSDFRQEPGRDTTVWRDHDYVRDCDAVICIVGKRSGFVPSPAATAPFAHLLPDGITAASYTQWEFFAARHYKKKWLFIYIAGNAEQPDADPPKGDDPALQRAFRDHIVKEQDLNRDYFADVNELRALILKQPWPDRRPAKPISLPYPSLGSLFKGRDAFLRDLHTSLTRGPGRTAITGSALHGLGGIGKTRAAVEYAWAHEPDYTALLFVIAETPEALRRNLAALAGPLVLNLREQDEPKEDVRLKAVLDWLKLHPGWLLILDNLDEAEAVKEADKLMSALTGGRVLITSRLSAFAGHFDPLELDVLGIDDAVAFLLERTDKRRRRTPDDAETARELATDLGGLALALEQAGAYVAKLGISFARYRELWRENRNKVAGWADERLTNYPRAVAVTWQTSVSQLTAAGRRLLERLAWFAPEPIPDFLLDVPVPGVEGEDQAEALANLADYSLARRHPDKPEFTIHRLVQDVTQRGFAGQVRQRSLVEALGWVNAAFAGDPKDVRTWPRLDPLAPHVRMIVEHPDDADINRPTARLMNRLGLLLRFKARYAEAERMLRRALATCEARYGADDPEVARALNNLAALLRDTNRLSEAEPLYRRALASDEASYGADHPEVARDLNNLALLLHDANRLSEAEPLYRRALAIDETSCGPNHPNVATGLNNLAVLLRVTNRLSEAEPMYRRALAIDEASYGPDHPDVARGLNNLAVLLRATNRLSEAEPMCRRALAINEASYGADHPNVARGLNSLAVWLKDTNRLSEAERLYRRALAIDEASYGPDHADVARDLNNLAVLLHDTDRLSEAEPLYRRALAIDEASYGPDHADVARDLNNLARIAAGHEPPERGRADVPAVPCDTGPVHGNDRSPAPEARIDPIQLRGDTPRAGPHPRRNRRRHQFHLGRRPRAPGMTPAVSIVMPVRNGAAYLRESVASIQCQDFAAFELLIVDDGSDDATAAMLASFAAADPRIHVFHQPPQGIVAALNAGIAQARAPYLARLDADDRARPDRLSKQIAFMEAHPEIGLLGTWAEVIDGAGNAIGRLAPPADPARLARVLKRTNPFVHSSVMMRTALVRRLGGYRAAFRAAEDYDLWLRMAEAAGVANLSENLVQYRRHAASQSQRDAVRQAFSVRLAQRSAAARRGGGAYPAAALTAPPDWWAKDAEAAFYRDDVGLYRFLDADAQEAARHVRAVTARLFRLSHVERRLAQQRLRAMLREARPAGCRRAGIVLLIAALHPGRALRFVWDGVIAWVDKVQ